MTKLLVWQRRNLSMSQIFTIVTTNVESLTRNESAIAKKE